MLKSRRQNLFLICVLTVFVGNKLVKCEMQPLNTAYTHLGGRNVEIRSYKFETFPRLPISSTCFTLLPGQHPQQTASFKLIRLCKKGRLYNSSINYCDYKSPSALVASAHSTCYLFQGVKIVALQSFARTREWQECLFYKRPVTHN